MVNLKGPLLSFAASGSLADQITYAKSRKGTYARVHGKHVDANSIEQQARRLMFGFVASQFLLLPDAAVDSYATEAERLQTSAYNAYLSKNITRWGHFAPPSHATPATEDGTNSNTTFLTVVQDGSRWKLSTTGTVMNDTWGIVFWAEPSPGFTPSIDNTIVVATDVAGTPVERFWTPPQTGQYFFRMRTFTDRGKWGTLSVQKPPPP